MSRPYNLITPEMIAEMVRRIEAGAQMEEIYLLYPNNHKLSLRVALKRNGYGKQVTEASHVITPELLEKAKEMIRQGKTKTESAVAIGFTSGALHYHLKRDGDPMPVRGRKPGAVRSCESTRPDIQARIDLNSRYLSMPMRANHAN